MLLPFYTWEIEANRIKTCILKWQGRAELGFDSTALAAEGRGRVVPHTTYTGTPPSAVLRLQSVGAV